MGGERFSADGTTLRIILAVLAAAAIGVAAVATGVVVAPSRRSDLGFEVAKAGIQLLVVAIVGGAVTAAFRYLQSRREDRRRLDEYRLGVLRDLIDAYHRIKAVRRTLRAYGLASPQSGPLRADQVHEARRQMRSLIEAQLSLERIGREVRAQPQVFRPDEQSLDLLIHKAERYVNHVVDDWERFGSNIIAGADAHDATSSLGHLRAFLAKATVGRFKQEVSEPVEEIERLIQRRLLSGSLS